ncbi:MAG: hypothetical protein ACI9AH_000725, partial [Oceanospirillaceae bacterium]
RPIILIRVNAPFPVKAFYRGPTLLLLLFHERRKIYRTITVSL